MDKNIASAMLLRLNKQDQIEALQVNRFYNCE